VNKGRIKGEGWEIQPMLDVVTPVRSKGEGSRARAPRTVDYGTCPSCHAGKRTGMVRMGTHLVWKVHERITMSKAKMVCPASGVAVCAQPGRGLEDPTCPHG
jgi:hypothetical protein